MPTTSIDEQVRALDEGRAYAELTDLTLTLVSGDDSREWLHDLVTTDVASLGPSVSRPSLLLSPTGRIRAAFHMLAIGDREFLLAQGSGQPTGIVELLAPYVLSSDVRLDASRVRIFALPGRADPPERFWQPWRPSVLGDGFDVLFGADDEEAFESFRLRLVECGLERAGARAVEARRVRRGDPRFPIDVDTDSLSAEAGWDAAPVTDRGKGCFLGQEAVAKVADLGHPTRVVVPVLADGAVARDDPVLAGGREVGTLTSADGSFGLARIRWDARDDDLVTASGTRLRRR